MRVEIASRQEGVAAGIHWTAAQVDFVAATGGKVIAIRKSRRK